LGYRVRIEKQASKALEKLDTVTQNRIVEVIRSLADNPRPPGSRKMKNREGWRVRIGDYRVIYGINDERSVVSVAKIGHRREVYREG
jgi:mRNA interferase RelE/StbE